jgi:hypothetical protein
LTAIATEQLTASPCKKKKSGPPRGIAARQRHYRTDDADVVITFRSTKHDEADVLQVLETLRVQIDSSAVD